MPVLNATADAQRPPSVVADDAVLENVASELLYPLTVIQLNAEELLQQFQGEHEDTTTADAAQALLRSVERMSQIVQGLMHVSQATHGAEPVAPAAARAAHYGRAKMRSS
jgi:signal transduction histidine kinase